MPTCETCGHDAAAIQSKLEARIAEQGARIKETSTMLAEAKSRAAELDARVKEFSAREEAISLREAESTAGWTLDERGRKLARWAYEDAHEATPAEERPTFAAWLTSDVAKADPVLASYRQAGAPVVPPKPGQVPGVKPAPTPPVNAGTTPPTRRTLDQINAEAKAVMASGLPVAEKAAKIAELKTLRAQAASSPTGA